MLKFKIFNILIKDRFRIFKGETFKNIFHYAKQYNSGGDDYNPPNNISCLTTNINNNEADTIVCLYNDNITKISQQGEKKLYSTDENGSKIEASIHFKNNGSIDLISNDKITIKGIIIINDQTIINNLLTVNKIIVNNGASGTFIDTPSGKSIIIENGIITKIT